MVIEIAVLVGIASLGAAIWQGVSASKTLRLTKAQGLLVVPTPLLAVHHINDPDIHDPGPTVSQPDYPVNYTITFTITNVGASHATLLDIDTEDGYRKPMDPLPLRLSGRNWPGNVGASGQVIERGRTAVKAHHGHKHWFVHAFVMSGNDTTSELLFRGRLLYRNATGHRHELGFCRSFNHRDGRWSVVNDPAHEYSR